MSIGPLKNAERQDRIARILVDATLLGDQQACDKYEVSLASLKRWRKVVQDDNGPQALELSRVVHEKINRLNVDWSVTAQRAINACLDFIERAATQIDPKDPRAVRSIAGALKLTAEITQAQSFLDAKISKLSAPDAQVLKLPQPSAEPLKRTG